MYAFFVLGWLTHAALQIAKKTEDLSAFYMEQPCQTYEECLTVRKHTNLPFVIDESVTDLQSLVKGSKTFQPQKCETDFIIPLKAIFRNIFNLRWSLVPGPWFCQLS